MLVFSTLYHENMARLVRIYPSNLKVGYKRTAWKPITIRSPCTTCSFASHSKPFSTYKTKSVKQLVLPRPLTEHCYKKKFNRIRTCISKIATIVRFVYIYLYSTSLQNIAKRYHCKPNPARKNAYNTCKLSCND